ncbi:hypothetical protein [Alkalibaculum bacchi]|uniref:hypothetical protein n=1 Tax=Alkalibaculum bacchi TaxID=645887 RepID=UPI0026F00725|nr:hypothetical protein [Alkalibaculum bacchi]
MKITVNRGYKTIDEGVYVLTIKVLSQDNSNRNYIKLTLEDDEGLLAFDRIFLELEEGTKLGELVKAVTGEIPAVIEDLTSVLIGAKVGVEIKVNYSEKSNRYYSNIVEYFSEDCIVYEE